MKLYKTNAILILLKFAKSAFNFELHVPSAVIEKRKKRLFCHVSISLHSLVNPSTGSPIIL